MASEHSSTTYSEYYASLVGPSKQRYKEKIVSIGFDPYTLKRVDFNENYGLIPMIEYPDIVIYLVLQTSWATNKQMKAYKSMDAYNFFVSGWVGTLQMKECVPYFELVPSQDLKYLPGLMVRLIHVH